MSQPGLAELNAVAAVAAHRSFRRAAVELGMSPSALSHAIATLEQQLGVRLFNRTTRSVAPTEACEQFLARVRPALRDIADAIEVVNAFRATPAGTLRLNSSEGAARQALQPVLWEFLRCYPEMQVDLVTEGKFVDIVAQGFDAGIRSADAVPRDMIAIQCSPPIRFAVVGSPEYFSAHGRPAAPGDLLRHSCIRGRLPSGALYPWEFSRLSEEIVVDVKGPLTLDSHSLMIDAALAGVGLIWTSRWSLEEHIAQGRLVSVLDEWCPGGPALALYYPGRRHVPAGLRAFVDLVRSQRNWP